MPPSIYIRPAKAEDAEAAFYIRSLARTATYPSLLSEAVRGSFTIQNEITPENIQKWSTGFQNYLASDSYIVKIADIEGRAVGWYMARLGSDHTHLMSMFVDPSVQGRGIGAALLADLFTETSKKDVTLAVLQNNISAIKFYEKHGFTEVKKLKEAYLGAPRIKMQKHASID